MRERVWHLMHGAEPSLHRNYEQIVADWPFTTNLHGRGGKRHLTSGPNQRVGGGLPHTLMAPRPRLYPVIRFLDRGCSY
jgi:hypothetical protein